MNIEEITIEDAKGKFKWIWVAFKAQFPNSNYNHEDIKKMIEVVLAIQSGHVRDESLEE